MSAWAGLFTMALVVATAMPASASGANSETPMAYVVTDIGEVPGSYSTTIEDLNDDRIIVGGAGFSDGAHRGFRWDDGTFEDVHPDPSAPADHVASHAVAVDAQGRIAGTIGTTRDGRSGAESFLAAGDEITYLDGLTRVDSMNNVGTVVGMGSGGDGCAKAAVWENGSTRVLTPDASPCVIGFARDVNDQRDIVGAEGPMATMWTSDGTTHQLGHLYGGDCRSSVAEAVNESRQVVGSATTAEGCTAPHAFLWAEGRMTDLGMLDGTLGSRAFDINTAGVIVGTSVGFNTATATIWHHGVMRDLNDLIADDGWYLTSALVINDAGDIVGVGWHHGELRNFILTDPASPRPTPGPVPPPRPAPQTQEVWLQCAGGPAGRVTGLAGEASVSWSTQRPTDPVGCGGMARGAPDAKMFEAAGTFEGRLDELEARVWLTGNRGAEVELVVVVNDEEVERRNVRLSEQQATGAAPVEVFTPVGAATDGEAVHQVSLTVEPRSSDVTLIRYGSENAPSGIMFNPHG